jgi:hypothetical protein
VIALGDRRVGGRQAKAVPESSLSPTVPNQLPDLILDDHRLGPRDRRRLRALHRLDAQAGTDLLA